MMTPIEINNQHYNYAQFSESLEDFSERYQEDINGSTYFGFPIQPILDIEQTLLAGKSKSIGRKIKINKSQW